MVLGLLQRIISRLYPEPYSAQTRKEYKNIMFKIRVERFEEEYLMRPNDDRV
jgi:hypothetical protein